MERVKAALGDDAKSPLDRVSMCKAADYSALADDGNVARNKREAALLISVAEDKLSEGMIRESLDAAEHALRLFEGIQDESGEADAISVIVSAHKDQAENEKQQPKRALELTMEKMKGFAQRGQERAEACMKLLACDLYASSTRGISMSRASQDFDKAMSFGNDALKTFQGYNDGRMEAAVHLALMNVHFQKKRPQETLSFANKAMKIYKELGDRKGEAKSHHGIAIASALKDDLADAVAKAQEALIIYQEFGDRGAQARELQSIAKWSLEAGKNNDALKAAQESLSIWRELGSARQRESVALLLVCEALAAAGQARKAVKLAKAGLERFQDSGDKRAIASGLEVLLEAYMYADAPEEAMKAVEKALATAHELGDKRLELNLLHQACHVQRHSREAGNVMHKAAKLAQELNDTDEEAQALLMYGYTQIQRMDIQNDKPAIQEALSLLEDARTLFRGRGYASGEGNCLVCSACLRSLNMDREQVLPLVKEAQAIFNACGDVNGEACSYRMIVECYLLDKQFQEALDAGNRWVDVRRAAGERRKLVDAMLKVASIHHLQGDLSLALAIADEAQEIISQVGCFKVEAGILCFIAEVHLSRLAAEAANGENAQQSTSFLDARSKAADAAKKALVLSGKSKEESLRGSALFLRAQIFTYSNRGGDALRSAMEAEKVFAKINLVSQQAHAQLLCAQLHHIFGDKTEAMRLANSALELVQQPGCEDHQIESAAKDFIDKLEPKAPPVMETREGLAALPDSEAKLSAAVAPAGLDLGTVRSRLYQLVLENIANDEDIDMDATLGDAGLDSLASVQLIADAGREFRISLSPGAVFDYPTVKLLSKHIVEESQLR